MTKLEQILQSIKPTDNTLHREAQRRLDNLTKPQGSLGNLEEFAARVVAITGKMEPTLEKKAIFTFAGDHGVAEEGVSAFPKEVTAQMVINFLNGGAGINVLASHVGAEVVVIDIGVNGDFEEAEGLVRQKIVRGTGNIRRGAAMTREEAVRSIEVGIGLAEEYAGRGYHIFGTGDMGIANTTPSSAIAALFTGRAVEEVTGRGTGIDDRAFRNKVWVIEDALKTNTPDPGDPLDILAKVGGAEIGGIAGLILGGASRRIPVVIDGFISTAGAAIACSLKPEVTDYIFAAHTSVERGQWVMLEKMELIPILNLNMRLGEGTGAALGISLIEAGVKIYNEMATFGEAGVSERDEGEEEEAARGGA